jgi:tetratricopeptide (TPR) repeat protein
MYKSRYLWIVFLSTSLLMGCKFYPEQPAGKPKAKATVSQSKPQPAKAPVARNQTVARLLADADYALSQNKLLMPIEDNAFDRYQSVLLIDPNNKEARAGLQMVALRYVELARNSIARGDYAQARTYLNNARGIDPSNSLLGELDTNLRRAQASQPAPKPYQAGPNEHLLDAQELTRKSPKILAHLRQLATKARDSGDLVIIHARNDAEGRWIYGQMRDALEDFLLRGDIKIAAQPRIQFVPAL